MLKIAITLVHKYSDSENEAQISTILGLVDRITDTHEEFDSDGNSQGFFDTYHYEIKGLGIPHEVRFYQVVPFNPDVPYTTFDEYEKNLRANFLPSNFNELDSHKVLYCPSDNLNTDGRPFTKDKDKTFFDWGLKRGTDHGADVSLYVEDLSKLNFKKLLPKLEKVKDKQDPTEFLQEAGAKIANVEYMKKGGLK